MTRPDVHCFDQGVYMGSYYSVTNWDAHPSNFFNPSKPPCSDFKDLNQRSGINVTVKVP